MYSATNLDMAQSQRREDHQVRPLLQYFLTLGCVPVTSDEVIDRVVTENLRDAHSQLQGCKAELRKLKDRLKDLQEVLDETQIAYDDVRRSRDSAIKEDLKKRQKILRKDIKYCEVEISAQEFNVCYCEAYLDGAHPAEAKRLASAEGNATTTSPRGNRLKEIEDRVKTLPLLKARRDLTEAMRRKELRWRQRPRMSLNHLIMSQKSRLLIQNSHQLSLMRNEWWA